MNAAMSILLGLFDGSNSPSCDTTRRSAAARAARPPESREPRACEAYRCDTSYPRVRSSKRGFIRRFLGLLNLSTGFARRLAGSFAGLFVGKTAKCVDSCAIRNANGASSGEDYDKLARMAAHRVCTYTAIRPIVLGYAPLCGAQIAALCVCGRLAITIRYDSRHTSWRHAQKMVGLGGTVRTGDKGYRCAKRWVTLGGSGFVRKSTSAMR